MGMVLWPFTASLDGFLAGPGDAMDWVFRHAGPNPAVEEVIRTVGALLVGRRSYDVGQRATRPELKKPFRGAWAGPQILLTHRPPEILDDPAIRVISGDIRKAVDAAVEAAAGKNVVVIGANVAKQCLGAGLVNEILVLVTPILLGDGIRFFGDPGGKPIDLDPIGVSRAGSVTNLRFRVVV